MNVVSNLPGWPPAGGGAFDPKKNTFAVSSEEVTIRQLIRIDEEHITFTCTFEGDPLTYDFTAPDAKTAKKLWNILEKHLGETLFSIGMKIIPED